MASCSSRLSEEPFLCAICLEVFTDPVSTQCGHNFCKACLTKYWDSNDLCQCPLCQKTFDKRPDLFVNTFISEMAAPYRQSVPGKAASSPDQHPPKLDVSCHFCIGTKRKARKSCLVCVASYCETHLEPHMRVVTFKKHKLIDPVENLEDRMCKKHERPLELFCRTDQTCLCQFCIEGDHKTHNTVPVEEECKERKTQMKEADGEVQQMIQERLEKVKEIKLSVETSKRDTQRELAHSVEVFTALARSIQISQAELIHVIEEKQKASEKQAEGLIKDLEQEITELKKRSSELEQLSHSEDHLHLLQSFPSLSTPPHTKDWSQISVHSGLGVWKVVSHLADTLDTEMKKLTGVKLQRIQQYAADVTLDPDRAHSSLILSKDGKQVRNRVRDGSFMMPFTYGPNVLGRQSFSSGRFYYEVQVEGKTMWILGVARESSYGNSDSHCPSNGYWTIAQRNQYRYTASPNVPLYLEVQPQKVGVFVDYEQGQVSSYNVEAKSHIYSFTGCTFTEKLRPYFCPCSHDGHRNSAPLIITPVNH